jgi:tRNA threonylcarbamoyladenosine biosynthesis protein TsaB
MVSGSVQSFAADGAALGQLTSLTPEMAAEQAVALVAGSQAEALVALRGSGEALNLLPDARDFALLAARSIQPNPTPLYGRAPDAKLPQVPR